MQLGNMQNLRNPNFLNKNHPTYHDSSIYSYFIVTNWFSTPQWAASSTSFTIVEVTFNFGLYARLVQTLFGISWTLTSPDESLHVISDRCVQRLCILQSCPVRKATVLKMLALVLLLAVASSAANVKQFQPKAGYYDTTTTDSWDTTTKDPWDTTTTYPWDDTTTTHSWDTTTTPTHSWDTTRTTTTMTPTHSWDTTTRTTTMTTTHSWDTTTTSGAACPLGWIDDGNLGCFLFAPQMAGLSWIEALEYCEEQVHILDVNFE